MQDIRRSSCILKTNPLVVVMISRLESKINHCGIDAYRVHLCHMHDKIVEQSGTIVRNRS